MITPAQSRAARALLGLRLEDLATRAGVSVATLSKFESGTRNTQPTNIRVLRQELEAAGILFVAEDGEAGPGVRLHRSR